MQESLLDAGGEPVLGPLEGEVRRTPLARGAWVDHRPGWLSGSGGVFSRLALAGGVLIDAQWDSPFLRSLGAGLLPRERYLPLLARSAARVPLPTDPLAARRLLSRT